MSINLFTVDAAQVSSLGSEGEDEAGLWSLGLQDCPESLDKTSLTPSEGTEEPGSPARSTQPLSLSPGNRNYWGQIDLDAPEDPATPSAADREGDQEPPRMFCRFQPGSNRWNLFESFRLSLRSSKSNVNSSIRQLCVAARLYVQTRLYFSFLMQHLSGFMMLRETPSFQLLVKPCLLLLFEKAAFWKHDKRSHPTQCHNISIHQRGDVTLLKSALRDARLSLLFRRDERLAWLAY